MCFVKAALIFHLSAPNSDLFILESTWMFVPNLENSLQVFKRYFNLATLALPIACVDT